MKYAVATVGAALVFGGAFLALMLLPVAAFPRFYESVGGLVAAYAVGLGLAATAAVLSFRATLRTYAPKPGPKDATVRCPACGEPVLASKGRCPLCGAAVGDGESAPAGG